MSYYGLETRKKRICYALRMIAVMLEEGTMEEGDIIDVLLEHLAPDQNGDFISIHPTSRQF